MRNILVAILIASIFSSYGKDHERMEQMPHKEAMLKANAPHKPLATDETPLIGDEPPHPTSSPLASCHRECGGSCIVDYFKNKTCSGECKKLKKGFSGGHCRFKFGHGVECCCDCPK